MTASLIVLFLLAVTAYVSFIVGKSAGVAECESEHTISLRLAAVAREEERRQDRAEVLSEALGLMGQRWLHPSHQDVTIDLTVDPPEVTP